ncbi:MAG: translation initiation factor IF-2 [Bdellovibrionota bacterium]
MQKVKVYELAKELGIDSMTLLDKLKQLDIDVKSHMSSLGTEEVKAVRDQIAKEQALLSKASKASSRKKEKEGEPLVQKRVGTTVIRRRAKASDEEGAQPAEQSGMAPTQSTAGLGETQAVVESEEMENTEAAAQQAQLQAQSPAQAPTAPQIAASTASPQAKQSSPVKPLSTQETTTQPPVAPKTTHSPVGSGLKLPSLLGARSQGLTSTRTSSILNIVKEDPIKRPVAPKPNVRPTTSMPGQPSRPGSVGIVNLGKEAIDKLVEEEQNFKKKGGAGRTERDKDPLDVKVSDYRAKKELIFLPKKKKVPVNKEIRRTEITTPAAHKRVIRIENAVTVSELAQRMGVKTNEVIKKLIGMGVMATLNHTLDMDTATLLAGEYGYEIENVAFKEENIIPKVEDKSEDLKPRPPIVTVMGHVDHGKTSLLDAIRSANVAAGEAGGITQHIGAYTVEVDGKKVTFIDTPGHEAFTVMRARGANVTDIVILVVAADDGVMPQTREAVDHARAANVPIIVAVNKIDKPGANPDKVMKGLAELNLVPEAWGGESIFVNVSALKRTGIKEILESILLQAEVLDLKANPDRPAEGTVLEARLDRSRGAVVDVLVKRGTLSVGDSIVAGGFCGRVRALTDDKGKLLKTVGPGYAAELLGLEGVPTAGDAFNVMASEIEARQVAEHRVAKNRGADSAKTSKMSLEDLFSKVQQGELKELPVILKTDVFGSTEAIRDSLTKLSTEKVKVKILSASTGGISESDVMLASASNAIIIGFNVRPETKARAIAESENIEIKTYSIIYELLDDVKKAMAGLLEKKAVERYLGRAEVRETFNVPKIGTVAGCSVIDGKITRGCQVRLLRDSRVIYTGKLSSLRRFKDDAKEVAQGYECGMGIENFNDIKQGDIIEAFTIDMVAQELTSSPPTHESARA